MSVVLDRAMTAWIRPVALLAVAVTGCNGPYVPVAPLIVPAIYAQVPGREHRRDPPPYGPSSTEFHVLSHRIAVGGRARCASAGGVELRLESASVASGSSLWNWALLPWNAASALSLGLVPMLFLDWKSARIAAVAVEQDAGGDPLRHSILRARTDYEGDWGFFPTMCDLMEGPSCPGTEWTWPDREVRTVDDLADRLVDELGASCDDGASDLAWPSVGPST